MMVLICLAFASLQIDRSNISSALTVSHYRTSALQVSKLTSTLANYRARCSRTSGLLQIRATRDSHSCSSWSVSAPDLAQHETELLTLLSACQIVIFEVGAFRVFYCWSDTNKCARRFPLTLCCSMWDRLVGWGRRCSPGPWSPLSRRGSARLAATLPPASCSGSASRASFVSRAGTQAA